MGGRPSLGSVVAKLQGPVDLAVPPFVGLAEKTSHVPWSDSGRTGFLGAAYAAFKPQGEGMADMRLSDVSLDRLRDRRALLQQLDQFRRDVDTSGTMAALDAYGQRALDVLTSSKLVDALDLSKEDPQIVARYGDGKPYQVPVRRRTDLQRTPADRPPAGGSRRARGHAQLRPLGQPRPELRPRPRPRRQAGSVSRAH